MKENDKQSCEQTAKPNNYDLGTVVDGPPPLQACNSCVYFQTKTQILHVLKSIPGVCQFNDQQVYQNLDSTCWLFKNKFIT